MASTQDHIIIQDIRDDVVILKNRDMAIILQTSAVNFGLLSENEQLAIISSFAGLLNSLSFTIQIVIRSKRLDITNYLRLLGVAQSSQTNRLLFTMIDRYRNFIRQTVKENEVLDKQFYICIPISHLEIGLSKNKENNFKKALTILIPRRDHLIRQLSRTGLRARQLGGIELVKLFYDIYNGDGIIEQIDLSSRAPARDLKINQEIAAAPATNTQVPRNDVMPPAPIPAQPQPAPPPPPQPRTVTRAPYIVEELPDEYGTI